MSFHPFRGFSFLLDKSENFAHNSQVSINSRGLTSYTGNGIYTFDMWYLRDTNGILSVSQDTMNSAPCGKLAVTSQLVVPSVFYNHAVIGNVIPAEVATTLTGKYITVSVDISTNLKDGVTLLSSSGTIVSLVSGHPGDGSVKRISVVIYGITGLTEIQLALTPQQPVLNVGDYVKFGNISIVIGQFFDLPYIPVDVSSDLLRCMRRFQRLYLWRVHTHAGVNSGPNPEIMAEYVLPVPMPNSSIVVVPSISNPPVIIDHEYSSTSIAWTATPLNQYGEVRLLQLGSAQSATLVDGNVYYLTGTVDISA